MRSKQLKYLKISIHSTNNWQGKFHDTDFSDYYLNMYII